MFNFNDDLSKGKIQPKRSTFEWDNEEDEKPIQKLPYNFKEIKLFDFNKSHEENFEEDLGTKYILIKVEKGSKFGMVDDNYSFDTMITPQSKCCINFEKAEDYGGVEFIPIDYDSIFGVRFTSFMKYNSNFFNCDERVIFEALLIKFKAFDFKPFYWSKEVIFKETGIKKDRATKIIDRFVGLGIVSKEVRKSVVNNRPQQITYYTLNSDNILELKHQIYNERDWSIADKDLEKYLVPSRHITRRLL